MVGIIYEILHVAFIITIAVQGEQTFYGQLTKQNYFYRKIIPVSGTLEELKELVEDMKEQKNGHKVDRKVTDGSAENLTGVAEFNESPDKLNGVSNGKNLAIN